MIGKMVTSCIHNYCMVVSQLSVSGVSMLRNIQDRIDLQLILLKNLPTTI